MVVKSRVRTSAAFGIVLILAAGVAGCGRRGRLEPPPDPNAPQEAPAANKAGLHKRARNPPIIAPNQPFVLDPLL